MSTNATAGPTGPSSGTGLSAAVDLSPKSRPGERIITLVLKLSAYASIAITFGIIAALDPSPWPSSSVRSRSESSSPSTAPMPSCPLVTATLMVTVIALVVAVPLGLGAALYLSEYASRRARKILKPTVELLAGVPSVVYGFFALTFVTPTLLQEILALEVGFTNALAAGLVLGVMIIPTIASLAEDAFSAVPQAMRQGSLAMGANRMQTSLRVVFPAALSGVAAAVVLGMSRAIGETMIVTLAAGSLKQFSLDPRDGMQTMTGFMATTAGGENPVGSTEYNNLFAVGLLLFVITLVLNLVSISFVRRYRQVY